MNSIGQLLSTAELFWFIGSARRRQDPYPPYRRLRNRRPLTRTPIGVWVATGHAEVTEALRNPALSSSESHVDTQRLHLGPLRRLLGRDIGLTGTFFERSPQLMLFRDPPDHTRLRRLVSRSFTTRRVQELEPRIIEIATGLVGELDGEQYFDLIERFAYPFPARVICELLGVPEHEVHRVVDHAPGLAAGLDPGPLLTEAAKDAANIAMSEIVTYVELLIERRLETPGDDLLSSLLERNQGNHNQGKAATGGDDHLSHDEIMEVVLLLLVAGHETTANLLGNGLAALLGQPDSLEELRNIPSIDDSVVDELLRVDSPVQMTMRVASEHTRVADQEVLQGSVVICCLGAANHDETVFDHPERIDWHRERNPHLSFGGGIHHCLGAGLARAETRIALRLLLDRFDQIELAAPPRRRPSFTIRGLERLELRVS